MRNTAHKADKRNQKEICLKEICFKAVRKDFAALGIEAVIDLPTPLIKDLLPHLTVCQLDELQPALNQRGISTHSGWVGILQDICGPNHVIGFDTEEEAKVEVMRMLFTVVFYGFTNNFVKRNITNLNTPSFLWAAAKCIKHFLLTTSIHEPLQSLTAEQRPLLNLLEKRIRSVGVSQSIDLSKRKTQTALYVLHRLLDHGVAKELVVHVQCPIMLAWLLHGRGSQYVNPELKNLMQSKKASCITQAASASADGASCSPGLETRASEDQDDEVTPCKRSKLDSVSVEEEEESGKANFTLDLQVLCQTLSPCDGPSAGACPWGQIDCLEIRQCGSDSLRVLNSALPTFFCLRSLTLHSISIFRDLDVLGLARALKQLSESSRSSLTDLSISVLPYTKLMEVLLDACPNVTSLHVEVQTVMWGSRFSPHHPRTAASDMSELPLEKLTVKVAELQTDLHFVTSVLRRSPHLTSLHVAGMRLPTGSSQSQLLTTLSESNHFLRSLNLEDLKLSDCLPEILNLLRDCKLEVLRFNDCRLLEKWSDKEESLQQLVAALKTVPSLHTLSLAQNRLAKNVCVLAELFSGSSPSSVKRLDISSNFIQPAELLEFAKRLRTHCPPHRLTLDLRKNPGDRDSDTWNTALKGLRPFCVPLVEGWKSTDSMADHISNM
ncbi:leucine-rich repeat-containing protein 41 isoform X2 [Siniperca chuatsi]|uniref:leucine-rich repeat-containing protein 41 isoform X2 n=1 Tax=Siniperca chuatsi TaxID=119488 RepID=UPI001CE19146|nr:leucine-rich repeat-containing protein 41 isoform X2 [Siniperca chuatsi]